MYRAFKSSDYSGSLVETAVSSTQRGRCEENQDAEERAGCVGKNCQSQKVSKGKERLPKRPYQERK